MEQVSEAIEAFRSGFPMAVFAIVPVLLIVVSPMAAEASHDFKVYRMQQYDMQGNTHGCRSALVNSESRTLQSSLITRKCVMIRSSELTYANYLDVLDRGPSGILILMQSNMSSEQTQNFINLEGEMLNSQSNVPVYFTYEDKALKDIYNRVTRSTKSEAGSALQALVDSATSVGYQLVANTGQSKAMYDHNLVNIEGVLSGFGTEDQLPTIAIVAHYDAFGVAPFLSYGANSDASGVVALLELARIMGKFYSSSRTHPKYNIVFLLSAGGKFNYQGSRKWLEEGLDNSGGSINESPSALLTNTKLVVCLDSLASRNSNSLRMHVSKPPSPGTVAASLHSNIMKFARFLDPEIDTSLVHKKIRLSSDMLAWEHERYSIRRLHAVTFSTYDSHDNPLRRSMLDTKDEVSMKKLTRNIEILAEGLIQHIYNVSERENLNLASGDYGVHQDKIHNWMEFLTSQPRPAQALNENHPVVTSLAASLDRHLKGAVQKTLFKTDKRDPEFLFYDTHTVDMSASIVRSAVFDLYVALVVLAYVSAIYFLIAKFSGVLFLAKKLNSIQKIKAH